jgi:hypothetical protein
MSKISITEKFAQDAINAPALVTGGKKCTGGKNKSGGKSNKAKSNKGKSGKSGGGSSNCFAPPPCKY